MFVHKLIQIIPIDQSILNAEVLPKSIQFSRNINLHIFIKLKSLIDQILQYKTELIRKLILFVKKIARTTKITSVKWIK